MAKRKQQLNLSNGEVEILSFLWEHGDLSLSGAHEKFPRKIGYTTLQTRLNRMVEKKLVTKSNTRPTVYSAAIESSDVSKSELDSLVKNVSEGKIVPLVAQLLDGTPLSTDEINEIKELIDAAEKRVSKKTSAKKRK